MTLFLPDTNIFIYAFNGEEPAASSLEKWIKEKNLIISAIVAAEYLSGGDGLERDKFSALLDRLGAVPTDTAVARIASDYKRAFKNKKPSLRLPDALIAATCKLYSATLVINNPTDFPMDDIRKNIMEFSVK